jgi:hypothetical protein
MSDAVKQKFLVLFLAPNSVIDDWMKTAPEVRAPAEQKMRAEWDQWMSQHAHMILSTEAGGKTRRVTAQGAADARNEIMLVSYVEAESQEAAGKAFETHPHLGIPQASIEVMAVRPM